MSTLSSAEALLTEHLRYTPLSLIDDIINTINAIVYRVLVGTESGLLETKPETLGFDLPRVRTDDALASTRGGGVDDDDDDDPAERQRIEIEDGVHRLETLLEATVDKTFDKFEIYTLRNILHVPEGLDSWVRLRHYEGLPLPLPSNAATPESIEKLRHKLQATQQLNMTLSHTHTANAQLLDQLKAALSSPGGQLSPLQSTTSPMQPSATFTKSQVPALKALLDDLRPRLQSMSELAKSGARPGQHGEERGERTKYVEGVVGRVVGTQLGATKEGDDELGQRRGEDEVRAMEKVAAEDVRGPIRQDDHHMEE